VDATKIKAMSHGRMKEAESRLGRRPSGKVKDPEQAKPKATAQRSFTDPESRGQQAGRSYMQGYTRRLRWMNTPR
jgi:hypothetical protein